MSVRVPHRPLLPVVVSPSESVSYGYLTRLCGRKQTTSTVFCDSSRCRGGALPGKEPTDAND